jgi:hypothetical protein
MGFKPQRACSAGGIEPKLLPPRRFVAVTMNFAMVSPAQWHGKFVTDLAAELENCGGGSTQPIRRNVLPVTCHLPDRPT